MLSSESSEIKVKAARQMFMVAWVFLILTAMLGLLLRWQVIWPIKGIDYGNFLHAHSHIGFLGWVFNAFFALAFLRWVPAGKERSWIRLFWFLQVANLGMLVSYPLQGYGGFSILFSTLHMGGSLAFAWKLWLAPDIAVLARPWLRSALVLMLLSGLGPLALGPLAALDLRAHPAYPLSIYWYLHFQYNGWFILFPIAWVLDSVDKRLKGREAALRKALNLSLTGIILTFLVSALWVGLPVWMVLLAGAGGILQFAGILWLLQILYRDGRGYLKASPRFVRFLVWIGALVLMVKNGSQLLACLPALEAYTQHRFIVIAFMHLVFLAVVLPWLVAAARQLNWMRGGRWFLSGAILLGTGVIATKLALTLPLVPGDWKLLLLIHHSSVLFWSALIKLVGVVVLSFLCLARFRR